ncbi:ABC transporter substrate-binding protein [Corynebacterium halotolerans]|uniref:ABC transporter substrate-binding protein n=1 Tax=Corynebacterium halotolerans TaxID=225326 RepID=UPI003CF7F08B
MSKLTKALGVVVAATALAFTAACGGEADTAATGNGEIEQADVTVGALPIADFSTLWWADENGFFEAEGLNVTIEPVQGGPVGAQMVASGELDFTTSTTFNTVSATDNGMPIDTAALLSGSADNSIAMYVKPDSDIQGIEDLDGATIGINNTNNTGDVTFNALADHLGVDVTPTFIEVPFPEMLAGVQSGSIDVGYSPEPYLSAAWDAGMRQIIDLTDGPNNKIATSNIVSGRAFLNSNPNTAAAFSRALYAANEDILANEQEWRDWLPSIAHIDEGTAQTLPMPVFYTVMDADAVQHIADLMISQGIVSEDYDASEFIWEGES